jgi:UDP-N-acetylmuramyl tripeptide synthase
MARMDPDWWWQDGVAVGPHGPTPIPSALPGHAAQVNALFALASAVAMGVTPSAAATAIARVENVDGRYLPHSVGDHDVRVLLAKNPASWTESITTLLEGKQDSPARSAVLAMSARGGGGGQDTAMLWDAPFERLAGTTITVAGSRRDELALRLAVAGVDVQRGDDDVMEAVRSRPAGPVDVVANWPAFNAVLDHTGRG